MFATRTFRSSLSCRTRALFDFSLTRKMTNLRRPFIFAGQSGISPYPLGKYQGAISALADLHLVRHFNIIP